ncbi:MAG: Crp/Fnr family transcriptional regulator [Bacteroidota bacterium]
MKSKETVILPGEICRDMFFILKGGFVCRYVHPETGEAKTINFYLEDLHPFMACVDSFFDQTPTNCELLAISDAVVAAFPKHHIDRLVATDPNFAIFNNELITTAMTEENELKAKIIAFSSKEKYDFILKEMPSVIQTVPSKYIAEFCGISPEWLSKLKKQSAL